MYSTGVLLIVRIKCAFAFTVLIFGVTALAYTSFLSIEFAAVYHKAHALFGIWG
jgi:hypothetical protein